jgi:hypothetical protein
LTVICSKADGAETESDKEKVDDGPVTKADDVTVTTDAARSERRNNRLRHLHDDTRSLRSISTISMVNEREWATKTSSVSTGERVERDRRYGRYIQ